MALSSVTGLGAFAVHLGPRLSMWSDEITRINGCGLEDLRAMDLKLRGGEDPATAAVAPGCGGFVNTNDIPLAVTVVRSARTGPLAVNVSADLGISWSF